MRKYILFAGHRYYPCGGIEDCIGGSDDINELITMALATDDHGPEYEWAHIIVVPDFKVVWKTQCDFDGEDRETEYVKT